MHVGQSCLDMFGQVCLRHCKTANLSSENGYMFRGPNVATSLVLYRVRIRVYPT